MENKTIEKLKILSLKYKDSEELKFNFDAKNGLRYVSDESLELALILLENTEIDLECRKINNIDRVIIKNKYVSLCNYNDSTSDLKEKLKSNLNNYTQKNMGEYVGYTELDYICTDCKYQKCPKYLAGYLVYLMRNKLLDEKLKDRENFRKSNNPDDYFCFKWNFGDSLKMIPDDVFLFAQELVKRGYVYVKNVLEKDCVKMYTAFSCDEYKIFNNDIGRIPMSKREKKNWIYLSRDVNQETIFCKPYSCGLNACVFEAAGYIYYLIQSGQKDQIIKARDYYNTHKSEMDEKLNKKREERITALEKDKEEILKSLEPYKEKVLKFEQLVEMIQNKEQQDLHCIIEGEDKLEKDKLIDKIVDALYNNKKIAEKNFRRISLQNLAANNAYSVSNYTNDKDRDFNGVLYEMSEAYKYTELKRERIYIINNIQEFIDDYNECKTINHSPYYEKRKKQFEHVIDLLTSMSYKNYIIIDGTEKEIQNFLLLDSRIQYIFKNNIFKMKEISFDELFELYMKDLNKNLIDELRIDYDNKKKAFIEYVSLNKNFMPFSNRELASYLANYSNSKGNLELPENIYKKETVEEALQSIIGMDNVKSKVKEFEKYMLFKVKAKSNGLQLNASNMHMVFTGNPGVGKTMIARIMAKMLFDLGIIKENKLIEVERKDLVANYIGQTATKTNEVIERAMGGVLFIDEAYTLTVKGMSNDYGIEAIATLIKAMEDYKDNFVVIFAGYKNEMKTFIDSNPGIASRIGYKFDFPDYNAEELMEIYYMKLRKMGFETSKDIDVKLKSVCTYFSKKKDFGNGRFIDKLIQETLIKHSLNESDNIKLITINEVPEIKDLNNEIELEENTESLLENIIGMNDLKEKIKEFEQYVCFIKEAEKKNIILPNQNMHMIFTGNPGTGKTTIARIMAKILYNAGIIHENKLIEVERKDLIASYLGQTAPKTNEIVEKAMGGVLFIDEAYSITDGNDSFGQEAIATLIKAMEDHKGEFIVIFAGYKKEMYQFLNSNSGIASRIGYTFDFKDYTREELCDILYKKIQKSNMTISDDAKKSCVSIMNYFGNVENIGNGRFVDKVLQEILIKHSKNKNNISEITKEDIPTIKEMTNCLFNGNNMIDPEKITKEGLAKTATHEIGHALTRYVLFKKPGIKIITINPEGTGSLGYVEYNVNNRYTSKKSELLNDIKVCLAGMAAEEIYFGEFANGNSSDLEKATGIARNMVVNFGMSKLGYGKITYSENGPLAIMVQEEINCILNECFDEVVKLLQKNKDKMNLLIRFLLKNKEITEEEFVRIYKD